MKSYKLFSLPITVLSAVILSCNQEPSKLDISPNEPGWQVVYSHDEYGNLRDGSIDSLINGIRNGYQLRVGWGWEKELGDSLVKLEHLAEPLFLSIIQETDISVVIDAHPLLASYVEVRDQKFHVGGHIWQCVLTTQGTFNAQVHNRESGELLKDWPQRQAMTWYLDYPPGPGGSGKPLFK